MTSRQESLIGFLILACASTFLLLTNVTSCDAQISSRRGSKVASESMLPQATLSKRQVVNSITEPANPPIARTALATSPMSFQIRSQLSEQRSFQTDTSTGSKRSRAIYNIRNQLEQQEQQDSQTVEELLNEIDLRAAQRATQSKPAAQLTEPVLDSRPGDQDLDFWDTGPQAESAASKPELAFDSDPIDSLSTPSHIFPNALPSEPIDATNPLPADLAFFELLAIENHPTLNASAARVLTARYEALQAGLHPNPRLGLFVDEAGNDGDLGLWGAFLQRTHVRGNKLALGQAIKNLSLIHI